MAGSFADRLARSRSGDSSALEELFARWRPLLRLQARRLLGAELSARVDPSDVVQEAFTQAFQTLEQFRGTTEGEWVAWLRRLVAGHAAKARRHHHADKRSVAAEVAMGGSESARGGAAADIILDQEQAGRLAGAIEELPADMREVILRRVFDRQPFEALAPALGRSPGAARVLWTRALRRLRQLLEDQP